MANCAVSLVIFAIAFYFMKKFDKTEADVASNSEATTGTPIVDTPKVDAPASDE